MCCAARACTYPSRGDAFPVVAVALDGAPPRDDLHEEDAEGVHVALLRELVGPEVLRVEVPRRALDLGGDVRRLRILRRQPREPEIRHLRTDLVRQQDVGGLDVSMDDWVICQAKEIKTVNFICINHKGIILLEGESQFH